MHVVKVYVLGVRMHVLGVCMFMVSVVCFCMPAEILSVVEKINFQPSMFVCFFLLYV